MIYKALINGQNFLLNMGGTPQKCGFYTTRWVPTGDPAAAEAAVVQMLKGDEKLKGIVLSRPDDPPMLYVQELSEDQLFKPATGFVFYSEDGDESS